MKYDSGCIAMLWFRSAASLTKKRDSKTNCRFDMERVSRQLKMQQISTSLLLLFFFLTTSLAAISAVTLVVCLVKIHSSSRVQLNGWWGEGRRAARQ